MPAAIAVLLWLLLSLIIGIAIVVAGALLYLVALDAWYEIKEMTRDVRK